MTQRKTASTLLAGCASIMLAPQAMADRALVIANFGYPDAPAPQDVRDRALDVSETLFGLGFQVTRLENPDQGELRDAVAALAAEDGAVVLYYAGRSRAEDQDTLLVSPSEGQDTALNSLLATLNPAARDVTSVFLDLCSAGAPVAEPVVAEGGEPAVSPGILGPLPQADNLLVVAPVAPGADCPSEEIALTQTVIERLQVPALDIAEMFEGTELPVQSTVTVPFVFRPAESGMRLTASDYKMFDGLPPEKQAQMLELWANAGIAVDRAGARTPRTTVTATPTVPRETVVMTEPVRPVSGGVTLVPVGPASNTTTVSSAVRLTPATVQPTPQPTSRPVPGTGGLPEPSIIVGLLEEETLASFSTATEPTGPVAGAIIEYTDFEGRRALRDDDPELFASLLESGAFDPPAAELAVALQTELARMNCYTAAIDGQWGPGSRASVGRYYEQIGGAAPSQDADVRIYRQIALRDDVTCPAVQAASPPPRPANPTRTQPRQTQTAPPAPAPSTGTPPRVINRDRGVGVGTGVGR